MRARSLFVWLFVFLAASAPLCLAQDGEAGKTQDSSKPAAQQQAPDKQPAPAQGRPLRGPTAQQLEDYYRMVWLRVGQLYYSPEALGNWGEWENKYKGKLTTRQELEQALKAMVESLGDRWTSYTSSGEVHGEFFEDLLGVVHAGMGLARSQDGTFAVQFIEYGSAAHNSDLRVGDVIKSIDGKELKGLTPPQADALLKGLAGATIKVVYSEGGKEIEVALTLAPPPPPAVEIKVLPGDVLYVRLPDFKDDQVLTQFQAAVSDQNRKLGGNLRGMILDLRHNPGGAFSVAVEFASYLIGEGTIVTSTTRNGRLSVEQQYKANPPLPHEEQILNAEGRSLSALLEKKPLVVLIDGSTMSAAEIVTGALKDNKRAVVVGTRSFGKAVGWRSFNLSTGGVLHVTTLKYLTPSRTDVSQNGIAPDRVIAQPRGTNDAQLSAGIEEMKRLFKAGNGK